MKYKISNIYDLPAKTVEDLIESLKLLPPGTLIHDISIDTTEDFDDDGGFGLNRNSYKTTHIEFDIKKYIKSNRNGEIESFYI